MKPAWLPEGFVPVEDSSSEQNTTTPPEPSPPRQNTPAAAANAPTDRPSWLPEGFVPVEEAPSRENAPAPTVPSENTSGGTEEREPSIWEKVRRGANTLMEMMVPGMAGMRETIENRPSVKAFERSVSELAGEPVHAVYQPPERSEAEKKADAIRAKLQNVESLYSDLADLGKGALGDKEAAKAYAQKALQMNKDVVDALNEAGIDAWLTSDGVKFRDEQGDVHDLEDVSTIARDVKAAAGETVGGIGGALAGARAGAMYAPGATKIPAALVGSMIGSYLGSAAGKAVDVLRNAAEINKQIRSSDVLRSALDAGAASAVTDAGVAVGAKAVAPAIKKPVQKVIDLATYDGRGAVDYVIKEAGHTPEEMDKVADEMNRLAKPEGDFGRAEAIQDRGLAAAMTDQTLLPDLIETVKQDAKAAMNLSRTIAGRAKHLESELSGKSLRAKDFQKKIGAYEKSVSDFFGNVQDTWKKAFDGYEFDISNIGIPEAKKVFPQLEGVENPTIDDVLEQLKSDIQRQDVVEQLTGLQKRLEGAHDIEDLLDLRKEIGRISRLPSVKAYKGQKALQAYIDAVDRKIESLPESVGYPEEVADEMRKLYHEANREYADMKRMQDGIAYKRLMKPGLREEDFQNAIRKLSESVNTELENVLEKLPKADGTRAKAEIALLHSHLNKALKTTTTKNKAVDFEALKKSLDNINEDLLKTPEAKQTLEILRKDADLFKNDYILQQVAGTVSERVANNIAVELYGKINMYLKSKMFKELQMFVPDRRGKHLAFQANLARALRRSRTPEDFIVEIQKEKLLDKRQTKTLEKMLRAYEKQMAETRQAVEEMTPEEISARLEALKVPKEDVGDYLAALKQKSVLPENLPEDVPPEELRDFALRHGDRGVSELLAKRKGSAFDPYDLSQIQNSAPPATRRIDTEPPKASGIAPEEIAALREHPPSVEEARVMERLGPGDRFGTFAQDIRYIREGRATDAQLRKYLEAKKAVDPAVFEAEMAKETAPKSVEEAVKEHPEIDVQSFLKDRLDADLRKEPYGFATNKEAAKRILEEKATPEDLRKLSEDIANIDADPQWREHYGLGKVEGDTYISPEGEEIDLNTIFANPGTHMATGFAGGTANVFENADENGDGVVTTDEAASAFAKGFLTGAIAPEVIKLLGKTNPELYAKVTSKLLDETANGMKASKGAVGDLSVKLGTFVGSDTRATGAFSDTAIKKVMREIDDSAAKFNTDVLDDIYGKSINGKAWNTAKPKIGEGDYKAYFLRDLIGHPELFSKYPDIAETNVIIRNLPNENFKGRWNGQYIELNIAHGGLNKKTLLHEIQHMIQQKEGWPTGGNIHDFTQPNAKELDTLKMPENPHDSYRRLWGEQQARATQYRADMNPDQRSKEGWTQTLEKAEGTYKEPIIKHYGKEADHAKDLEDRYLLKGYDGEKVNESALMKEAEVLPQPIKKFQTFKKHFNVDENGRTYIVTPIGRVFANASKAWGHLTNNTHFDHRGFISGAFFKTLHDPLFVVKQPYKGGWNIVFYKPFKSEDGNYHLAAFAIDQSGQVIHKTFYEINNLKKIMAMIKAPEGNVLYEKTPQSADRQKRP